LALPGAVHGLVLPQHAVDGDRFGIRRVRLSAELLSAAYRCPASIQPASKGGGITYLKRILALAVATAVVAGGGVAWAQSNGSSQSQKPAATKSKQQTTPRANRTAPRDHDCPFSGSGASSDAALDL